MKLLTAWRERDRQRQEDTGRKWKREKIGTHSDPKRSLLIHFQLPEKKQLTEKEVSSKRKTPSELGACF